MEYIEDDTPPPEVLELAWQCERFHSLPSAGGILDQPYKTMKDINVALNVYTAWSEWKKCPKKNIGSWMKKNPKLWDICNSIIKARRAWQTK